MKKGNGLTERQAFEVMWQHNKDSDPANHWMKKQTLGTEVGRQMGQEPGARARRGRPYSGEEEGKECEPAVTLALLLE
ncbi:hypothetical protein NQZ68_026609 [Dissostichus eleginoides]|nr:hypothetical protein NQZ68_026609 [Dissostichus eleginoides]